MTTGWLVYNNKKFYFDSNGIMKTGWVTIGSKSYYFKPDGSLAVNTTIGKYRVGKDGARIR
jgi:glucan-binding YG repeat protein